ncbi:MAG: winged helix-turn-helix transcriptional regulator [Thiolinea sp.]
MRTLTISLTDSEIAMQAMKESFIRATKTGEYQGEAISYATPAQLFRVFTQKRWELIACLQDQSESVSIRELARQLGRDVRRVHDDVQALMEEGVIEKEGTGIHIPFAEIHTDFTLRKAA